MDKFIKSQEVFESLIKTIERNSNENNEAVITNVALWAKSWRKEMEMELEHCVLNNISNLQLNIAKKALTDIKYWDDDKEGEWGDCGYRASEALEMIISLEKR